MTNPTPITVIGSCVANQVVRQMPDYNKHWKMYYTDDNDVRFREKLSANFVPAGNVADRLYEDMKDIVYKDVLKLPYPILYDLRIQLEYVTKARTLESTLLHSKMAPGSVIYFDIANELLPSVITQDEEFLLKNNWFAIKEHFPNWFTEFVNKNTFYFDMYDKSMTMDRHHRLRKAVGLINEVGQPVVALGNTFTNRVWDYETNTVAENIPFYNQSAPFITIDRYDNEKLLANYKYIKKNIDRFYKICLSPKMSPGWTWIDTEPLCFADPKHEDGPHPIHLHMQSRKAIGIKLQKAFETVTSPVLSGY